MNSRYIALKYRLQTQDETGAGECGDMKHKCLTGNEVPFTLKYNNRTNSAVHT